MLGWVSVFILGEAFQSVVRIGKFNGSTVLQYTRTLTVLLIVVVLYLLVLVLVLVLVLASRTVLALFLAVYYSTVIIVMT
jgi:hypothetical protein